MDRPGAGPSLPSDLGGAGGDEWSCDEVERGGGERGRWDVRGWGGRVQCGGWLGREGAMRWVAGEGGCNAMGGRERCPRGGL